MSFEEGGKLPILYRPINNYLFQTLWEFDMKKFEFDDIKVPEKLEGEYILYIEFQINFKGTVKKECWKKRGEVSHF